MTPDQDLKAALIGDASAPRARPARDKRQPRGERPRRSAWPFRWGIKLLMLALMVMISRGLMRAPEVKLMLAEVQDKLVDFVDQERAARAAAAASDALDAMQETEVTAAGSQMPESRIAVRRVGEASGPRVIEGPVEDVFAGNALMLDGVPVVLDGLTCAAPASERGAAEAAALSALTRSRALRCTVSGAAGEAAVTAACTMQGGRDVATAMLADRHCTAG